jgi:hypothetical protein
VSARTKKRTPTPAAIRAVVDVRHSAAFAPWRPRLAPDGAAWLVVQRNLESDLLEQRIAADLGLGVERAASSKGLRMLRVTR